MTAALLAAALAASASVDVHVLSRLHPRSLLLEGPRAVRLEARGDSLLVDGMARDRLELPEGLWRVEGRTYEGAPRATARAGEVELHVRMALEDHVAAVVASETPPGTPDAALRAQAIVARSYDLAARRHADGSLCDLAHCQVLAGAGPAEHRARAARAARDTAGLVLVAGGAVAPATFHAECAGHTADPGEVFGGEGPSRAVPDPGCGAPWAARLPVPQVEGALRELLEDPRARLADLAPERGAGGYLARVIDRRTGRFAAGDAFVRALGRAAGWSAVRSGFVEWRRLGGSVELRGRGLGHGVGLCQAGAARLARQGRGELEILARYFPGATVGGRR